MNNPDYYAAKAEHSSKRGWNTHAFCMTTCSIEARAEWVLINGHWRKRQNIMRKAT